MACLWPADREALRQKAESYWSDSGDRLAAYSVRSGFDLLLQALDLKAGDEVIYSALNVKGMINIARRQNFCPVPVDLDLAHMAPSLSRLEQAISERSKVLVVAHLFGTHIDLDPLFDLARRHNLLIVEDCAQAFNGRAYSGHPKADLAMFSFGPLKTATALGGALIRVRDPDLRRKMRAIQSAYPMQTNRAQLIRVCKFAALKMVTSRLVMAAIYRYFKARGRDYEDALADSVRNVAKLGSSKKLRYRPSAGLLALLARRIYGFKEGSLEVRAAKGRRLRDLLGDSVVLPGQKSDHHDYWVFPLLVDEPAAFIEGLRAAGFDGANLPRSQAVAAPAGREELAPKIAAQALADMIIVPCYGGMPDKEITRQAEVIKKIAQRGGTARTRSYAGVKP